ncbi:MAG: DUF92 domain-containing protein [Anaerolineales bacterium]
MSTLQLIQLIARFLLGPLVGIAAWKMRALTPNGTLAAAITGALIFGLGGLPWATLLMAFFITSSTLSRLFKNRKTDLSEKFAKGGRRDWGQVAANGGLGALLVIFQTLLPDQTWPWLAFAGAMAAVNADTWATELGILSQAPPRLITSGEVVEKGTSGGVSLLGVIASLAGAALIGGLAGIFPSQGSVKGAGLLLGVVAMAGLAGSLFDSLLGATVQAIYTCPACQKETERHPHHTCGSPTRQIRGWPWLNNDVVNLAASVVGAAVAVVGWVMSNG